MLITLVCIALITTSIVIFVAVSTIRQANFAAKRGLVREQGISLVETGGIFAKPIAGVGVSLAAVGPGLSRDAGYGSRRSWRDTGVPDDGAFVAARRDGNRDDSDIAALHSALESSMRGKSKGAGVFVTAKNECLVESSSGTT